MTCLPRKNGGSASFLPRVLEASALNKSFLKRCPKIVFTMTDPPIAAIEQKLDEIVSKLKNSHDPEQKRELLREMRALMADLDRFVLGQDGLRK